MLCLSVRVSCVWCVWCVVACRAAVCRVCVRAACCVACGAVYDVLLALFYFSIHCCSYLLNALEKQTQIWRNQWKLRMLRNQISKTAATGLTFKDRHVARHVIDSTVLILLVSTLLKTGNPSQVVQRSPSPTCDNPQKSTDRSNETIHISPNRTRRARCW